jgi:dipeptidyl aminopeptidase/acylaminoacyl peptidase
MLVHSRSEISMKSNRRPVINPVAHPSRARAFKKHSEICVSSVVCVMIVLACSSASPVVRAQSDSKQDDKKKKPEPFKVQRLTQGMGLYAFGPISPDKQSILMLAQKPDQSPNLYVMNLSDHAIRPPLTSFKWGVADSAWSPDGLSVALAGFNETATFSELYTLELKTGKLRQMTSNAFSDKEPVYLPGGKRVLYTTDESPLPDAAFGILHVSSIAIGGGKPEVFTEDDGSFIHPGLSGDGKSVLLVKVDEQSGRHSLWQYGLDGKPQRDLTERQFARIHRHIPNPAGGSIVIWGQEEPEQQDGVYVFDLKSGKARELPDQDMPKRTPSVSPDGMLIAFIAPTDSGAQLFVYDSATGQIQQLTNKPARTHSPVFVSNNEILFGSDRDRENEIYLVNLKEPTVEDKKKK